VECVPSYESPIGSGGWYLRGNGETADLIGVFCKPLVTKAFAAGPRCRQMLLVTKWPPGMCCGWRYRYHPTQGPPWLRTSLLAAPGVPCRHGQGTRPPGRAGGRAGWWWGRGGAPREQRHFPVLRLLGGTSLPPALPAQAHTSRCSFSYLRLRSRACAQSSSCSCSWLSAPSIQIRAKGPSRCSRPIQIPSRYRSSSRCCQASSTQTTTTSSRRGRQDARRACGCLRGSRCSRGS
jgi:hypothetical protein